MIHFPPRYKNKTEFDVQSFVSQTRAEKYVCLKMGSPTFSLPRKVGEGMIHFPARYKNKTEFDVQSFASQTRAEKYVC